jgi:prephenate dehydrogenase
MEDSFEGDFIGHLHVHIIGLGLMGGSLALALRGKLRHLTADDLDPAIIQTALSQGVIGGSGEVHLADVVVLAVPVHHMPSLIADLAPQLKPGALLIDLGSTKTQVCAALDEVPETIMAVGGHPMCGLAENSFSHATATLYQGARFVLCPTQRTAPQARILAEALVNACEAVPVWLDRTRHDFLTAVTSHLPHLLNFALMHMAMELSTSNEDLFMLAAGGFDGATRLARTHESMITGMFTTNADNLRQLTQKIIEQLQSLNILLDSPEALQTTLHEIVQTRRAYSQRYGERYIS